GAVVAGHVDVAVDVVDLHSRGRKVLADGLLLLDREILGEQQPGGNKLSHDCKRAVREQPHFNFSKPQAARWRTVSFARAYCCNCRNAPAASSSCMSTSASITAICTSGDSCVASVARRPR